MTRGSGLSEERLERVHDVLAGHVERGTPPGLVAAIVRRGEVHVDVIGTSALGGNTPVARDSIFRIASMSKPVTAVATMILLEEARLRLDDPVDGLLPELAGRRVLKRLDGPLDDTVPAERPITVRDLLTFRLGWGIVMAPPGTYPIQAELMALAQGPPDPAATPPPDEWIRRLGALPLMHQPGASWMYHTGSDVLGVLIARGAGQPFETFLRERIFEPLGMKDTGFSVPADRIDRLVTGYWTDPATGALTLADEPAGGQWSAPPAFPSGGGGLVSTIDDYLAFAQMLLAGGRHGSERIISRPAVELMTSDHLTDAQRAATTFMPEYWDDHGWGFGVAVVTRRHDLTGVGTYGWDGGLGTSWRNDPSEEMTTVLLTQAAFTSPVPPAVHSDFRNVAYHAIDD
jgi:CubicO group peptidase (beta-lactamase class C family)